jgi:hypothetical protein
MHKSEIEAGQPRSKRRKVVALASAFGLALAASVTSGVALTASPASAACVDSYVNTNGSNPFRVFHIASNSTCDDLNFREASVSQYYRGMYNSGENWYDGAPGWLYRTPSSSNNAVAIYNISNGTPVAALGDYYDANLWARH